MNINKNKLLPFISLFLIVTNFSNIAFCQVKSKVEYTGNFKEVRRTKKILNKYDLYLILNEKEVKIDFNDSIMKIENITIDDKDFLRKQEFILVKFLKNKYCFYSLLPNGFFLYSSIKELIIYNSSKICILKINKHRHLALNFLYVSHGRSFGIPISLIPCYEYKGEYDYGMENYIKSLKKD